jgi:hypothetical protein
MKLLVNVNQVECLRYGVDAPSSTVKIEVDPGKLSEEERALVADEVYEGLRFPYSEDLYVCPPTYEGFMAAVRYALKKATRPREKDQTPGVVGGFGSSIADRDELKKFDEELRAYRKELITEAISAYGKRDQKLGGPSTEIAAELSRMARSSLARMKEQHQREYENLPEPLRRKRSNQG